MAENKTKTKSDSKPKAKSDSKPKAKSDSKPKRKYSIKKKDTWYKKLGRGFLKFVLLIIGAFILYTAFVNLYIVFGTKSKMKEADDINKFDYDAILVLGCSVKSDGPSNLLRDRLDSAYEVYEKTGLKIIVSGDHEDAYYNEVKVMKEYLVGKGVPSEDIYMDHSGFSTYDSMYRAKSTFGIRSVVVITQQYHLYRSVYTARSMGMNAVGVPAIKVDRTGQRMRDLREILSRDKAYVDCIRKEKPKVTGDKVDMEKSGDLTD